VCSEFDDGATEWGGRPVARQMASLGPRQRVVLTGTVRGVRARKGSEPLDPTTRSILAAAAGTWFEADLDDGTGQVTLRWTGRLGIPGIEPGAGLRIRGTVLREGERLVILNPLYEFA
jgi:hypothetical protein